MLFLLLILFLSILGVIFRSSTNVEDLPGFNGAGLYSSEPLDFKFCQDWEAMSKVIKNVWASVWTKRGMTILSMTKKRKKQK